ncbi:MAG TPA: protein kinase [Kofleriaceae bacterium]
MTRYELLDRIGVGGMAEIFRGKAVAAGGFEKPVAIKRILPHLSQDKRFVELLIAEAKVLSLLKHRNIVQIFDVGLGDDGQYFLVMEYVDGKDIGAIQRSLEARRDRLPFDLVLHLGSEICEALEHAHSARAPDGKTMSLVHRDVSPSNVLLSRAGEVKLTDFGIAKRAEQEATGHGAVRGKFAYISPEQARNEHLEPRSDVFSVGILMWELVTGRRLFSGLGDLDALRSVREAPVPRPREADPRLSPEIDALIAQALSRDPKQRPTAGQLGQQLRSLRYSLEATSGDPATELAKILDGQLDAEVGDTDRRKSRPVMSTPLPALHADVEMSEATVIRIHTAEAFSTNDHDSAGVARARQVIDRFEDEETRLAQLSRDEIALLHAEARESGELTSAIEPPRPAKRRRPPTDDPTSAGPPLHLPDTLEPSSPFEADEATRLLAPASRRTPPPQRVVRPPSSPPVAAPAPTLATQRKRPSTQPPPRASAPLPAKPRPALQPPPMPADDRTPEPMRYTPPPGTTQHRLPSTPAPGSHPAPPMQGAPPMSVPRPMPQHPAQSSPMTMSPAPRQPPPTAPPPMQAPMPQPMQAMPQPIMQTPMPGAMMPPPMQQPPMQQPPMPGYGSWGAPPQRRPPDLYDRQQPQPQQPMQRPSAVALGKPRRMLQPWMLVIGALVMALLAFAITRAFIHAPPAKPPAAAK